MSPCDHHALVVLSQLVLADPQRLLSSSPWPPSVRAAGVGSLSVLQTPSDREFALGLPCSLQHPERSRLLAFYQHLRLAQATYLAGAKTLPPPPLKLESQEPSGPPGDSERNKGSYPSAAGVFGGNEIPAIRTQTLAPHTLTLALEKDLARQLRGYGATPSPKPAGEHHAWKFLGAAISKGEGHPCSHIWEISEGTAGSRAAVVTNHSWDGPHYQPPGQCKSKLPGGTT